MNRSRARSTLRAALLGATLTGSMLASQAARADSGAGLEELLAEPVISTASKSAERASEAPGTSTVITAEDIRRYGLRTLNEVINYASLGMMTTNPLHSVEIGARGVLVNADYGNHVLLLIDGHAVNEPSNGTAYFERGAGVPFELIDHIEVVLGPGSVLYGSEAMLGVINIVTKRAKDYRGARVILDGELATADFDRDDLGTGYRASGGLGYEFDALGVPAELTLQAEYHRQDGPVFTLGPQVYGDDAVTGSPKRWSPRGGATGVWGGRATDAYYSETPAAYARLLVGDFRVTARASSYERASPYLDALSFAVGDFNEPRNYEVDRFGSLDIQHAATVSRVLSLNTRVYGDLYGYDWYDRSSAAEDCLEGQVEGCERRLNVRAEWAGAELQGRLDWLSDGRLQTLIGADGRLRHVESAFPILDLGDGPDIDGPGAYDRVDHSGAVYLQHIARPAPFVSLSSGARADVDARFGVHLSPRLAASFYPWRLGTLKLMYSEAFRGPGAYQLEYADPNSQLPARGLEAETVRSVEASFEQRIGGQRLLLGAFRSWWDALVLSETLTEGEIAGAIERGALRPGTVEAYQYRNSSRIENQGFVIGYEGALLQGRLQYGANLTAAHSRVTSRELGSTALPVAPQLFGNARVSYDLSNALPTLALAAQFLERRPADRAYDGGHTPRATAPPHLELRATASGPMPQIPGLSYRCSVNYSFTSEGPYAIGPNTWVYSEEPTPAELSPVERMRAVVSLQYEFEP